MTLVDQLCHHAVLQIGRLRRHVDVTHRGFETASRSRGGAEGVRHQIQEQECQRDIRRAPDRFTQRQRPVGRQLHDQPLGQWLQRPVILILWQVATNWLTTRHDDGSDMSGTVIAIGEITIIPLPRHRRISTVLDRGLVNRLILWTHIPAIDCQSAVAVERDERPGSPDLLRVEDQRPGLDLFHLRFQHAKPRVDLVGDFILTRAFLFQRPILGEQLGMSRTFVIRHRCRIAG